MAKQSPEFAAGGLGEREDGYDPCGRSTVQNRPVPAKLRAHAHPSLQPPSAQGFGIFTAPPGCGVTWRTLFAALSPRCCHLAPLYAVEYPFSRAYVRHCAGRCEGRQLRLWCKSHGVRRHVHSSR